MPLCERGTTLTDLRSAHELARWASREGDCWDYRENRTPYWKYCRPCHMRRWPNDRRYNNRWSSPAPPWYNIPVSSVCHLLAGDLYLTREPPELRREESQTGLAAGAAPSRCVSLGSWQRWPSGAAVSGQQILFTTRSSGSEYTTPTIMVIPWPTPRITRPRRGRDAHSQTNMPRAFAPPGVVRAWSRVFTECREQAFAWTSCT